MQDIESEASLNSEPPSTSGGWESAPTCKRHSYKGGSTCLKCGASKPVHTPRVVSAEPKATRVNEGDKLFRNVASMTWMGLGIGVEYVADRYERAERLAPVGKVLQFEAAIAGPRIQRGLKRTPLWRIIVKAMTRVGPWAELLPLLGPPLLVGLMSFDERLQNRLGPALVAMMVPLMTETAAMAEEQAELISQLQQFNQESVNEAMNTVASFFGSRNEDESKSD